MDPSRSSEEKGFKRPSSAAQTFPPELLCEIFLHCISKDGDSPSRRSMRCLSQAPLSLGRICSLWRVVSINLPELWSSIAIEHHDLSHVDIEKDLKAIRHWISKSDTRPLSILIHYPPTQDPTYLHIALLPELLESLVSQCWRWKEVKLAVPSTLEDILLAPFQSGGNLPQLMEFDSTTIEGDTATFLLTSAPLLQVFRYSGDGIHVNFAGGQHSLKQIEICDSKHNDISLVDLFMCFTHCPLLVDLAISISLDEWVPDELPSTIELSHLTHLDLKFSADVDPCGLFDRLFLPALIRLELAMIPDPDVPADWPHLQTMLAHSHPPLQALILWTVPMTEETLVGCLSYIPNLKELELHGMVCTNLTLDSLTVDEVGADGTRCLCPCLETLNFGTICRFSEQAMAGMIISRWRSAKNSGFTRGNALTLVQSGFDFSRIRSNPDIAKCLSDGLVLKGCKGRKY